MRAAGCQGCSPTALPTTVDNQYTRVYIQTHIIKILKAHLFKSYSHSKDTFTEILTMVDQVSGDCGPAKLTYRINHHSTQWWWWWWDNVQTDDMSDHLSYAVQNPHGLAHLILCVHGELSPF